jgi:hypothetical protein
MASINYITDDESLEKEFLDLFLLKDFEYRNRNRMVCDLLFSNEILTKELADIKEENSKMKKTIGNIKRALHEIPKLGRKQKEIEINDKKRQKQ